MFELVSFIECTRPLMLTADALTEQLDGLVHLETQRARDGIDLTVGSIFRTTGPGQLDFGGSEFREAPRTRLDPVFENPRDDYGWWDLEEGAYIVRYNETFTLSGEQTAIVAPLERTMLAGAHHGACLFNGGRDPLEMLLNVSRMGCRLKENCRLSRLVVLG